MHRVVKYVPGNEPSFTAALIMNFVVVLLGLFFFVAMPIVGVPLLALSIALVAYTVKHEAKKQKEWTQRKRLFDHGWICHQCGSDWAPPEDAMRSA